MTKNFFTKLENTKPFLKMALEGFAGSGKTFTSAQIVIGLHAYIGSKKPIVWYDTERALKALKPYFDKTGIEVLTRESRSLVDLNQTIELCEKGESDILVIDSITHVWETFLESYKQEKRRSYLQFQDWGIIKPKWKKEFSDRVVMSNIHIIFTGRAGYEYDQELNEVTGKKELFKTGIKMKVENETEYEPDIVVLMSKYKEFNNDRQNIKRVAEILKDRTNTIDSKIFENPKFEDFKNPISILLDGTVKEKNIDGGIDTFKTYEENQQKNRNKREILLEEIKGFFGQLFPGQSANEKRIKLNIVEKIFRTNSWKQIEGSKIEELEYGATILKQIKPEINKYLKECINNGITFEDDKIISIIEHSIDDIWERNDTDVSPAFEQSYEKIEENKA